MNRDELERLLESMDPQAALSALSQALKKHLTILDDEDRVSFLVDLFEESCADKIGSMVHRWLAECLDEGVDPTHMCRSLVEKVGRSELLQAVTEPDVLVLFEDWLEELEREVLSLAERGEKLDVDAVSETLGLSWAGARFLVAKLEREGRI